MESKEPTAEQCSNNEIIFEDKDCIARAIWYPSMGGYVGKCVVLFTKSWVNNTEFYLDDCFEAFVWHNGKFPFGGCENNPVHLHHCDPIQFLRFGELINRWIEESDKRIKK